MMSWGTSWGYGGVSSKCTGVGHEHIGVRGATPFFEGFAPPVTVGQVIIFTEATGLAVGATLDTG